jgi:hypothetical protein
MSDADKESSGNNPREHSTQEEERKKDSTTKKTLRDVAETEKVSEDGKAGSDRVPAPDAQPSEERKGPDDAGPM